MAVRYTSFGQTKKSVMDRIIASVRINKVKDMIPRGSSLLDLGCGYDGELLDILEEHIGHGEGIDLSVKSQPNLRTGRVDSKLPYPDNTFDVVTALAIIEHVDNPGMMLSEAKRILKPGGKVIITTPSLLGKLPLELMATIGMISKAEIDDHKRYYTRLSLEDMMKRIGIKNIKVRRFGILWLNLLGSGEK